MFGISKRQVNASERLVIILNYDEYSIYVMIFVTEELEWVCMFKGRTKSWACSRSDLTPCAPSRNLRKLRLSKEEYWLLRRTRGVRFNLNKLCVSFATVRLMMSSTKFWMYCCKLLDCYDFWIFLSLEILRFMDVRFKNLTTLSREKINGIMDQIIKEVVQS